MTRQEWYRPKQIAEILHCSEGSARRIMKDMPGCVNAGTETRQQLLVPAAGLEDWLRNRKLRPAEPIPEIMPNRGERMPRMNRRTGKIERVS